MSGPKRNADKLNTIGVVVVGVCGAVLVYVTIVALEAFYVNDTSEIQTMADYGGQDTMAKMLKADQLKNLADHGEPNGPTPGLPQTYRIPIDVAKKLVIRDAKIDTTRLAGPAMPPANVQPKPPAPTPPPGAGSGSGSAVAPAPTSPETGSGSNATAPPPPPEGSAAPGGHAP
jgi:hypothetical protein